MNNRPSPYGRVIAITFIVSVWACLGYYIFLH